MKTHMDSFDAVSPATDDISPLPGAPRQERSFTSRIVRSGARRQTLHLSGSLDAGWAGRLAAGLAAHQISVVRATARRTTTRWVAEIAFDVLDPDVEPSAIDFLALINDHAPAPMPPGGVALSGHRVVRTRRDVLVELRAVDAVGFLGRILHVFANLGLYPHEMRVETHGSEIRDVFRLQSATGEVPPEGIVAALRARLDRLARAP